MDWVQKAIAEARELGLRELNLCGASKKQLSEFPMEILDLTQLEKLDLSWNQMRTLPKEIARLENLTTLNISANPLHVCPMELSLLSSLRSLDVSSRAWSAAELVTFFESLFYIEEFSVSEGRSDIVDAIIHLAHVKTLTINRCQLVTFPTKFARLSHLTNLILAHCGINKIPDAIADFPVLEYLDVTAGKLDRLPPRFGELTRFRYLSFDRNLFSSIPEVVLELRNLQHLSFRRNRITKLPSSIAALPYLTYLGVQGNPIEDPPPEIVAKGLPAIRAYFSDLAQGTTRLFEAKLIIVGEGEVGKTCLSNRLVDPDFDLKRDKHKIDSTRGIDIKDWLIKCPATDKRPAIDKFKVNIWDFGGQEIYHATHQFFLTKRSLYIFVWDARKEDRLGGFDYWLNAIGLLSGVSPILVVLNKSDERVKEIDQAALTQQFGNINGFHKVSALTGAGIAGLLEQIQQEMSRLPHVGDDWPASWSKIRTALETDKRDYMDYAEYLRLCEKQGLDRPKADVLGGYLHDLGVILHFQDDPLLQKIVILKPEWGTNAVYQVLDTSAVQDRHGRFSFQELGTIWNSSNYPPEKHAELLQLMIKFELCFRLNGSQNYIAPELLPAERPDFAWDDRGSLRFEYHYRFMPAGIITRFIARKHHLIDGRTFWRNGVVLRREDTRALVLSEPLNRRIRISVVGSGQKALLEIVRDDLDHIRKTLNNPDLKEMIPCICRRCQQGDPFFFDFRVLQRYLEKGISDARCEASLEEVSVHLLLAGVFERNMIEALMRGDRRDVIAQTYIEQQVITTVAPPALPPSPAEQPRPPQRHSPWGSGSFYLVAAVMLISLMAAVAHLLPALAAPGVMVGGMLAISIVGALQLRNDGQLKEKNFLKLMGMTFMNLPRLLGGSDKEATGKLESGKDGAAGKSGGEKALGPAGDKADEK